MSSKIFVESINDQKFVQAVAKTIEIEATLHAINDETFFPKSIDKAGNNLKDFIKSQLKEALNGSINKIGIIIDLDDFTMLERFSYVNDAIKNAIQEEIGQKKIVNFTSENQMQTLDIQGNAIDFACYFMKVGNRGHLDTVLKEIAMKRSDYANCLETWKVCVKGKSLQYDQNQYEKFWVNTYINLDTCLSSKHKGNKEKYCSMKNFEELIKKDIFNLEHECLNDLKTFLKLFN
jgi:hypothetical protein